MDRLGELRSDGLFGAWLSCRNADQGPTDHKPSSAFRDAPATNTTPSSRVDTTACTHTLSSHHGGYPLKYDGCPGRRARTAAPIWLRRLNRRHGLNRKPTMENTHPFEAAETPPQTVAQPAQDEGGELITGGC